MPVSARASNMQPHVILEINSASDLQQGMEDSHDAKDYGVYRPTSPYLIDGSNSNYEATGLRTGAALFMRSGTASTSSSSSTGTSLSHTKALFKPHLKKAFTTPRSSDHVNGDALNGPTAGRADFGKFHSNSTPLVNLLSASEALNRLRKLADEERKEFSKLQDEAFYSIGEHEVMEASFQRQFELRRSMGGQAADFVAAVGGSWRFVCCFFLFISVWMFINSSSMKDKHWDPYPFILLNLFLSTLSAFQAPIIMMSQNRQSERDRAQSDYTARLNLRAELMTRHINAKLDALLSSSWRRLLELQTIQSTVLEQFVEVMAKGDQGKDPVSPATASTAVGGKAAGRTREVKWSPDVRPQAPQEEEESRYKQPECEGCAWADICSCGVKKKEMEKRAAAAKANEPPVVTLVPGMCLEVYDGGGEDGDGQGKGRKKDAETVVSIAGNVTTDEDDGEGLGLTRSSSILTIKPLDAYIAPLASLCVASPAPHLLPGLQSPWLVETEGDEHLMFLLRIMLRTGGCGGGDESRLMFEHRLAGFGDNFSATVTNVKVVPRQPSLVSKGVYFAASEWRNGDDLRARPVSSEFVSRVIEVSSQLAQGGGAESFFPFDINYELEFSDGAVLDSILAGDGIVTLRNAFDTGILTATGQIKHLILHPRGCPCSLLDASQSSSCSSSCSSAFTPRHHQFDGDAVLLNEDMTRDLSCPGAVRVNQGEVPPRFKPSLSKDREDRIADFWKLKLSKIELSYTPAPIFACITLRSGQHSKPVAVEFLTPHSSKQADQPFKNGVSATSKASSSPGKGELMPGGGGGSSKRVDYKSKRPALMKRPSSSLLASFTSATSPVYMSDDLSSKGGGGADDGGGKMVDWSTHSCVQDPPELFVIINPSAELLCNALAFGFEAPKGYLSTADSMMHEAGSPRKETPLRVDRLPTHKPLPHNVWLSLSVHDRAFSLIDKGGGWEVDMPEVVGPAVLIFYSPEGRLRLKGYLRDDWGDQQGEGGRSRQILEEGEEGEEEKEGAEEEEAFALCRL